MRKLPAGPTGGIDPCPPIVGRSASAGWLAMGGWRVLGRFKLEAYCLLFCACSAKNVMYGMPGWR